MVRNKTTPRMSTSHSVTLAASSVKNDFRSTSRGETSKEDNMSNQQTSPLKSWKNKASSQPLHANHHFNSNCLNAKKAPSSDTDHSKLNGSSGSLLQVTNCNGHVNTDHHDQSLGSKSPAAKVSNADNSPQRDKYRSRMHASGINMYRKMFGRYKVGQELLARWSDGLYYLGVICDVYDHKLQCEMKFEDDSRFWVHYKDLHLIEETPSNEGKLPAKSEEEESDVTCVLCRSGVSEPPDEIVLCDKCGQGYHQLCHLPHIDGNVLKDEEVPWQCRNCVFSACVKRGGAVKHGLGEIMKQMKCVLPYDLPSLTWNKTHKINDEEKYCYCGGPGDWYLKMLQCTRCNQWFHEACLQCLDSPILYGDRFFLFVCSVCNEGNEFIKRLPMKWVDIVHLVLYNITIAKKVKYYDVEAMVVFFNKHVGSLHLTGEMAKEVATRANLRKKIAEVATHNKSRFQSNAEGKKTKLIWGLRNRSPPYCSPVSLPAHGEITEETFSSLDLRNGSATVNDSPTPLKRQGPCQFEGPSPQLSEKTLARGQSPPGRHIKNCLFNFIDIESDCSPPGNMPPPKRKKPGRPKKTDMSSRDSGGSAMESSIRKRKVSEASSASGQVSESSYATPKIWRSTSSVLSDKTSNSSSSFEKAMTNVKSYKEAVAKYFGAEDRVKSGECFRILGKRVVLAADGSEQVQYLIEWEGYTASDLEVMKKF